MPYNRILALEYARKWAFSRNPEFYDFSDIGGDCTNFVSQCIYAGCRVMNFTPVFGWYYINSYERAPAWTGVSFFYDFITSNKGAGPYGRLTSVSEMQIGDVIQLGDSDGNFYHTLLVTSVGRIPSKYSIRVTAHSNDAFMRPLSRYSYSDIRYIHIEGVRQ